MQDKIKTILMVVLLALTLLTTTYIITTFHEVINRAETIELPNQGVSND